MEEDTRRVTRLAQYAGSLVEQMSIVIDDITPTIDGGRFPVKTIVDEPIEVGADIWKEGHELLKACVLWRRLEPDEMTSGSPSRPDLTRPGWHETPMTTEWVANDRWFGTFVPKELGRYVFTIMAWTDVYGSWAADLKKRVDASQVVSRELLEGLQLIERAKQPASGMALAGLDALLSSMHNATDDARCVELALGPDAIHLMAQNDQRADVHVRQAALPLQVERPRARTGAWYEVFPRSQGTVPGRSATFKEAAQRLPAIAAMGFDVVYLAPIHPIGKTHRKGANNTLSAEPDDPGSPWAIGNKAGGHTAIHPDLGTLDDFDRYVATARSLGMEIALDIAIQCSPDHPWVREHPQWFSKHPDGTIKYAENPPKKYQDIYPINFGTADKEELYATLLDIVLFWVRHDVKIFRVDNPHTKPLSFWEWLITETLKRHPDVIFLSEAFTRPKRMLMLGKVGFTQSYTYFTWRTTRWDLQQYATELFLTDVKFCMRPNFFANTPDILHEILQKGGRPAFIQRLVLAATLSPSYGIYNSFELCENRALQRGSEGSEDYLDSEKYQYKVWDWDRPGNIIPIVSRVNQIRREHRSLQLASNLCILESSDQNIIAYAKRLPDGHDLIIVIVNLDPFHTHESMVRVPQDLHGANPGEPWTVLDLLSDARYPWQGDCNYVCLDPGVLPAHVLHVERTGL